MRSVQLAMGSSLVLVVLPSIAQGQQRTFVSGTGSDANLCNRTGPCRTIAQAISITNPGGEVIVLDSAGYSSFTVSKSISIAAPPGVYAGISVFSGDGITVSAGASDTVILRGLTVNNQGSMGNGIFATGGNLQVERCVVTGFNHDPGPFQFRSGLRFEGSTSLEVKDSFFRSNDLGIAIFPAGGSMLRAAIDRVRLEGNDRGVILTAGSQVTVRNSLASGNNIAFEARSDSATATNLYVENCVASGNFSNGVLAESASPGATTVKVSNSTITNNGIGLQSVGSTAMLLSRVNNTIEGNTTNTLGTIGTYGPK